MRQRPKHNPVLSKVARGAIFRFSHPAGKTTRKGAPLAARRSAILPLLVLCTLFTACSTLDDTVTTELGAEDTVPCADLTSLSTASESYACLKTGTRYRGELKEGVVATAWFRDEEGNTLVGALDGSIYLAEDAGWTKLSSGELNPKESGIYTLTDVGFSALRAESIARFYPTEEGLLALTKGAGAYLAEDGRNFKPTPFAARFSYVKGEKPLRVRSLNIAPDGRMANLVDSEAPPSADEVLALHNSGVSNTEEGGGPLVVTGLLQSMKVTARSLPLGRKHWLLTAPGEDEDLWLMSTHPERDETTRFISKDYGEHFLDTGYFDFLAHDIRRSDGHVIATGLNDAGAPVFWSKTASQKVVYARLESRFDGDTLFWADVSGEQIPTQLAVTDGQRLVFYNVQNLGADVRLLRYYWVLGFLFLIGLVFVVRRILVERKMPNPWAQQAYQMPGRVPDPGYVPPAEEHTDPEENVDES